MNPAEWAPKGTPALNLRIAEIAQRRVGEIEDPPGSNRSPWIDAALARCGLIQPKTGRGYPWCAAGVADWWREAGADVPPISASFWRSITKPGLGPASCDGWLHWALATSRFASEPAVGAAVLYGTLEDASHIGVILRLTPLLLSIEGNTSFHGYSREGVVCDLRPVTLDRVIGYVHPEPQR